MPYLGIDTATSRGSIALATVERIRAEGRLEERGWHARDLLDRIDELLTTIGAAPRELLGIGVAVGPGSFTGVRIGMATAKGLAYALRIGVAGLSTLEALALSARSARGGSAPAIAPVIDAGRGEVYSALFRIEGEGLARRAPDRSWVPSELAGSLPRSTMLVGDGVEAVLSAPGVERSRFQVIEPCPTLAGSIARWAARSIAPDSAYRVGSLAPNYVRPSDAEAKRRA